MIQFDNGPSGGDFVRYIDGLLAQRMPVASMETDGFVAAPSPSSTTDAASAPRLSKAQANALAKSVMTSQGFQPSDAKAWINVLGVAAGGALALIGIFIGGFGLCFTLIGIVLISTMFKRIFNRPSGAS